MKLLLVVSIQDVLGHSVEDSLGAHSWRRRHDLLVVDPRVEQLDGTSNEWFATRPVG